MKYESARYELSKNSIVMLQAGQSHSFFDYPKVRMTVLVIYFDSRNSERNSEIVKYLFQDKKPFHLKVHYAEETKKHLRQILYEQKNKPPAYEISIRNNFDLALLNIFRARIETESRRNSQVGSDGLSRTVEVLDYIAERSHEHFPLRNAAKMARLSTRQFTNNCRKATGKSYIQFLNFQRCEKAKELIETTETPVASIAFEVGYEDISTFYRAFNNLYKTSPLSFRHN